MKRRRGDNKEENGRWGDGVTRDNNTGFGLFVSLVCLVSLVFLVKNVEIVKFVSIVGTVKIVEKKLKAENSKLKAESSRLC